MQICSVRSARPRNGQQIADIASIRGLECGDAVLTQGSGIDEGAVAICARRTPTLAKHLAVQASRLPAAREIALSFSIAMDWAFA